MSSAKVYFGALVTLLVIFSVQADYLNYRRIQAECGHDVGITMKEILESRANITNLSERMLCYIKCTHHKMGFLDDYGVLNMTTINFRVDRAKFLSVVQKKDLRRCLRHIGSIKECGDVRKAIACDVEAGILHPQPQTKQLQSRVECAEEVGLTWEEFLEFQKNKRNPSKKIMCFVKCTNEKQGKLNEYGELNFDVVDEKIEEMRWLNSVQKKEYKECLKTVPPVKECEDSKPLIDCFEQIRFAHHRHHEDCVTELKLNKVNDLDPKKALKKFSEDNLCYLRCRYQKDGRIDENGELNLEIVNKNIERARYMKPAEKEKMKRCLAKIPPIKNCEYMKLIQECNESHKHF